MEMILGSILSYLISLAANERSAAINETRQKELEQKLSNVKRLRKALASHQSLRDELAAACVEFARNRDHFQPTAQEESLIHLLSDDIFQSDLADWLMAGGIEEGKDIEQRLSTAMETALKKSGASPQEIARLRDDYFEQLNKVIFSNETLAHWRHKESLDYLRRQVSELKRLAEEAAGQYSPARQEEALDKYRAESLKTWDIIDLSNMPEGDIQIATQKLLLRQLYLPLRLEMESPGRGAVEESDLDGLEEKRESRRMREAGRHAPKQPDPETGSTNRAPVGKRLAAANRLVVLGDPGGGKTTMLRWIATAYLLKHAQDSAFESLPDVETLPPRNWIPVLIRCRDIGPADLCRCFPDFLTQHLYKTTLQPEEADIMRAVILDRIARGEALLLIDGLDEINDPSVRATFCRELECTAARYPEASIIVTSRIVGYRDMPYRLREGFEHGTIADLDRYDKDLFARNWVELTESHKPAAEKEQRVGELIEAFHSTDRIERLTGNPMLLTTLALVKRKVGRLPNRRTKLYAEAVSVLLNWNPHYHSIIEEDEALPQLEYLAFEMCRRGVQRLTEDDVLDCLEAVRTAFPNVRALKKRDPEKFLQDLEERSSIIIKSGGFREKGATREKPVWEFRHLTFQEYLAARALHQGHYPGWDKNKQLAEEVSLIAGTIKKASNKIHGKDEFIISEAWKETLRLFIADAGDNEVDELLLAILAPRKKEKREEAGRARVVLAALCLADEPNVSEETADAVLTSFTEFIDERDGLGIIKTSLDEAGMEVGESMWVNILKKRLMENCLNKYSYNIGGLWGMIEASKLSREDNDRKEFFLSLISRLQSADLEEKLSACFTVMVAAYEGKAILVNELVEALLLILEQKETALKNAAAWALGWLGQVSYRREMEGSEQPLWLAKGDEVVKLINALENSERDDFNLHRWLIKPLGWSKDSRAFEPILKMLDDPDERCSVEAYNALGILGDKRAVEPLIKKLADDSWRDAFKSLRRIDDERGNAALKALLKDQDEDKRRFALNGLSEDLETIDRELFWSIGTGNTFRDRIDPLEPIMLDFVREKARELKLTEDEVRARYEKLAAEFDLKLEWQA